MRFHRYLLLFLFPLYLISCKPTQKLPYYLDKVNDTTPVKTTVEIPELVIQKNDLLSIQIYSLSTKPELSDAIYNQPSAGASTTNGGGYQVDLSGNIFHHRLGEFHAEGKTKKELASEIKKRLTEPVELLSDPSVIIRFLNFKITVLGQVGQAGVINVPGESITILEAVGLAGGINDYGKKHNLKILRETNGVRETGTVDLSSKDLFESPYYHLVQNDVLIVDETNQKMKDAEESRTFRKVSFAFTMVTVAATIANIFFRN